MTSINKLYSIITLFVAIFLLFIFLIIRPLFGSIKNNAGRLLSMKNEILLIDQENKAIDDFKKKYDGYKPNLDNLGTIFVDSQNPVHFIEFMEKTAKEEAINDLNTNIIASSSNTKDPQKILTFKLSFTSDFSNIVRFTEKMEKGTYLVKINQLEIRGSKGQLSANMLLQVQ
jgi:hypothetical protein